MKNLWLKFKDTDGSAKEVLVETQKFSIGRTPDNNLQISQIALSRKHIEIERFADIFVVSDCGSSNGTKLNGTALTEPVGIQNGDRINLGNAVEIQFEIVSDGEDASSGPIEESSAAIPAANVPLQNTPASPGAGIPMSVFVIAPLFGLCVLGVIGVLVYVFSKPTETAQSAKTESTYQTNGKTDSTESEDESGDAAEEKSPEKTEKAAAPANSPSGANADATQTSAAAAETPQKVSTEADKIERASISFLRSIAAQDSTAFLTGAQMAKVSPLVSQLKSSGALTENLKNARREAAQIGTLAKQKNLPPQFVAAAALAQLGNRSGSVFQTAQSMIETLSNLRLTLGNELANDALLIVAAYDQGAAGKNLAMRDTVANLSNKFPSISSRTVRTIWFLREQNKLTDAEFDFALRFLAVGIIMQNPADFSVKADAVTF